MGVKLNVIKKPLEKKLPDIQPNFGDDLGDLHLELLENKKRLKPGVTINPKPKPHKIKPEKQKTVEPKVVEPKKTVIDSDKPKPKIVVKEKEPELTEEELEDLQTDAEGSMEELIEDENVEEIDLEEEEEIEISQEEVDMTEEEISQLSEDDEKMSKISTPPDDAKSTKKEDDSGETSSESSDEDEQEDLEETVEEYIIKFKTLKRSYPNYQYPDYSSYTDLATIKSMYKETFKMIQLDETVDSYKTWLMAGFFLIECAGLYMGMDFKGFTKFQHKKMQKYERLLIELGEKKHMSFMNNWPVEVRLLGIIIFDAAVFYIGKIMKSYIGGDIFEILSSVFGLPADIGSGKTEGPKVRMRGPSTKPDDIRNMNKSD